MEDLLSVLLSVSAGVRTVGVTGSVSDDDAGEGKAGAENTHLGFRKTDHITGRDDRVHTHSSDNPSHTHTHSGLRGDLPPQEAEFAGAVLVHDDAQGQGDGAEQEGAYCEG